MQVGVVFKLALFLSEVLLSFKIQKFQIFGDFLEKGREKIQEKERTQNRIIPEIRNDLAIYNL